MTVVQQSSNIFDIIPSIVILLGALYFVFSISMGDLESCILPANSNSFYIYSVATFCFYLLGFFPGYRFAEVSIMKTISNIVLIISLFIMLFFIFASRNRINLFNDKLFSYFKKTSWFYGLIIFLPLILGFFSSYLLFSGELISILYSVIILIALFLFTGKATVHNRLYDSLRTFYFSKDYTLFDKSELTAYLISENDSFFFIVPFTEKECTSSAQCNEDKKEKNKNEKNKNEKNKKEKDEKEETKEKSIFIAVNKSLVTHYKIAEKNTKGK